MPGHPADGPRHPANLAQQVGKNIYSLLKYLQPNVWCSVSSLLECHLQTLSLTTEGAVTEQGQGEGEDMLSYDHLSHDQVT